MSFRFNFPNPDQDNKEEDDKPDNNITQKEASGKDSGNTLSAEMELDLKHMSPCNDQNTASYDLTENMKVVSVDPKHIENEFKIKPDGSSAIHEAITSQSDIIPNKYEGGLNIWECSVDLAKYIATQAISGMAVAELGCGAGLPGLCALKKGASTVLFQDFNNEVLSSLTVPNVLLNSYEVREKCTFFSGDWGGLPKALQHSLSAKQKYNIILTAETIYNAENYQKLINVFDNLLDENGDIYVASKNYYFGVGGGTRQFEFALQKDGRFTSVVCWTKPEEDLVWYSSQFPSLEYSRTGVIREILHLQRKKICNETMDIFHKHNHMTIISSEETQYCTETTLKTGLVL